MPQVCVVPRNPFCVQWWILEKWFPARFGRFLTSLMVSIPQNTQLLSSLTLSTFLGCLFHIASAWPELYILISTMLQSTITQMDEYKSCYWWWQDELLASSMQSDSPFGGILRKIWTGEDIYSYVDTKTCSNNLPALSTFSVPPIGKFKHDGVFVPCGPRLDLTCLRWHTVSLVKQGKFTC